MGDSRGRMMGRNTVQGQNEGSAPPTNARVLYRGIVVDCIQDPNCYDEVRRIIDQVVIANPQFMSTVPRNSLIVQPISDGLAKSTGTVLAYPFFPPHICMPVKPGEQVWLIGEKAGDLGTLPFWIARCPEPLQVDDVNYTHGDRKLALNTGLSTASELAALQGTADIKLPGFNNGDGTPSGSTISDIALGLATEQEDGYEFINRTSFWTQYLSNEPVPRFSKRPQDLVLQGSNNTAIILGEDRGWGYEDRPDNSELRTAPVGLGGVVPSDEAGGMVGFNGTIDIVAGRGRFLPINPTVTGSIGDTPETTSTAPRTIENQRGTFETDKNPVTNNLNPLETADEGDPDFKDDSSRVYVSMHTAGDKNFGIDTEGGNIATPFEGEFSDLEGEPFVVMCSDNVRIVARKNDDHDINGSIRIVKQGALNDDHACIVLQPDGTIQISGNKIYLGRVKDNEDRPGGEGALPRASDGGLGSGPDGTSTGSGRLEATSRLANPMVRYYQLEHLVHLLCDGIISFSGTLQTHATPGFGFPSPQINAAASSLAGTATQVKSLVVTLASERIYGE